MHDVVSSAIIVGLGGLGCPASLALAAAGVRRLTLCDPDRVEASNLHRQPWHRTTDIGRVKVESAAEGLLEAFPDVELHPLACALEPSNAEALVRSHEVVIDACDRMAIKFMLSDLAVRTGTPLIYGGVLGWTGQAMRVDASSACLRCLFEEPPPEDALPTCAQAGVIGPMPGLIGALQASLALDSGRAGELIVIDGRALRSRTLKVKRRDDCPTCSGPSPLPLDITSDRCPLTYVKVKLALERLAEGDRLVVRLAGEEPLRNVPRSLRAEGHEVLELAPEERGVFRLVVKKRAPGATSWT